LGFFCEHGFYPKEVRDSMLASKILYNGDVENVRHDFGSCMSRELSVYYDKTDQKNIHIVKLSQLSTITYSFNDVDKLLDLENEIVGKIINRGSIETYRLHCRYIRALAYMEQCGLPISSDKWLSKMAKDIVDTYKAKNQITEYIYDHCPEFVDPQLDMFEMLTKRIKIRISSPLQMLKVFASLGIPTKDKDGKDSINEEVISKSNHEFVPMWIAFQNANHRVTTFGEKIYNKIENERIYTSFNPMVDTARLSTRKGQINFLNFPADKDTRKCFEVKSGQIMIVCDYSGQETVIAADMSGDEAMTNSVLTGADLHCAFARILNPELAELSDEEIIKNHKDKRQAAKAPRFAFQYGGSAYTIHQKEGIPMKEAQAIEDGFKELHSGLYVWGNMVFEEAIQYGYIESADGWKLKLPFYDKFIERHKKINKITREEWKLYKEGKLEFKEEQRLKEEKLPYIIKNMKAYDFYRNNAFDISRYFKLKSEYMRLCLNNPVQTTGAHQIKRAKTILFDWIIENEYQGKVLICNSVHDELVVECPEDMDKEVSLAVSNAMVTGGNYYLTNLKIKADAGIGRSWAEAK
jgi:DNA polymerase I-like protein with 3'-5' exonuclease and polymerase domains